MKTACLWIQLPRQEVATLPPVYTDEHFAHIPDDQLEPHGEGDSEDEQDGEDNSEGHEYDDENSDDAEYETDDEE